jgi:hypothetical protein
LYFGDIDDLFGRMYSREGSEQEAFRLRGADLEAGLELDFLEAVRGGDKTLTLSRAEVRGSASRETVTIRIPPGVDSKGRLRIPGKGAPGIGGGEPWDLGGTLRIRPHRIFKREVNNLTLDLPISVREAILGAQVDVPTLDGRATLTAPARTDSGARLRLRGKGVPAKGGSSAGDVFVRVQIKVPVNLGEETEAMLKAIQPFEDPEIRKDFFMSAHRTLVEEVPVLLGVEGQSFLAELRHEGTLEAVGREAVQASGRTVVANLKGSLTVPSPFRTQHRDGGSRAYRKASPLVVRHVIACFEEADRLGILRPLCRRTLGGQIQCGKATGQGAK